MADVFISHSHEDAGPAALVCRRLEAHGISCWIAPRDVPPAADYADAIMEGISAAPILLLLLSDAANRSPHVRKEVEQAARKRILPARLENIEPTGALKYLIGHSQWVDLHPDLTGRIPVLVQHVRELLARSPSQFVEPARAPVSEFIRTGTSWLVVAAAATLWLLALRAWAAPLLPIGAIHRIIMDRPIAALVPIGVLVLGALALTYLAERRTRSMWRLRPLFTTASTAGRIRIASAALVLAGLAGAIAAGPAPVAIEPRLEELPPPDTAYDIVYVNPSATVVKQTGSHYRIRLAPGAAMDGRYTLLIRVHEYGTENGLEFGALYLDRRLNRPEPLGDPEPDYQNRWATYTIPLTKLDVDGARTLLCTFAYDPRSKAMGNTLTVSLRYEDYPPVEETHEVDVRRWSAR